MSIYALDYIPMNEPEYSPEFEQEVNTFMASLKKVEEKEVAKRDSTRNFKRAKRPVFEPFHFDPNTIAAEGWEKLGLKKWQSNIIEKYKAKGGKFRVKKDLQKIYGVDSLVYARMKPYINLPDTLPKRVYPKKEYPKREARPFLIVDLNLADTLELRKIRGIGPAYSRRIVKYREKLGGFRALEQLMEVYGIQQETYDLVAPHFTVDTTTIARIDINKATYENLKSHPYINYNLAKVVIAYRSKHGHYLRTNDIQKTGLVNGDLYRKLAPYLKVEYDVSGSN